MVDQIFPYGIPYDFLGFIFSIIVFFMLVYHLLDHKGVFSYELALIPKEKKERPTRVPTPPGEDHPTLKSMGPLCVHCGQPKIKGADICGFCGIPYNLPPSAVKHGL